MSDETVTPTTDKPAKASRTRKPVPFSSIHVRFATSRHIDTTKAAKLNRSYIRANFDTLVKSWPELRKSQKSNRDGNRYPDTIPAHVADMVVKRAVPVKASK